MWQSKEEKRDTIIYFTRKEKTLIKVKSRTNFYKWPRQKFKEFLLNLKSNLYKQKLIINCCIIQFKKTKNKQKGGTSFSRIKAARKISWCHEKLHINFYFIKLSTRWDQVLSDFFSFLGSSWQIYWRLNNFTTFNYHG